ncbi:MAG: hypothetical protein ACFFG0_54285 [Candidatus Thorarchaeota archaeon]
MGLNLFYTFVGLVVGLMICIPIWFYIIDKFTTHLIKKTERNIISQDSNMEDELNERKRRKTSKND